MFERFTDRARKVVVLAQEEARLLDHNYIGTEHLLLGLLHEGDGVAVTRALESLDISLTAVRAQVEEIIGHGGQSPSGHIPFTPRAKKVLEMALREALQLGHNYIGTEHILLGLIREGEGVAAQVLRKLGADLPRVRQAVIQLLSGYAEASSDERSEVPDVSLGNVAIFASEGIRPATCGFCGTPSPQCGALFTGVTGALICERCLSSPVSRSAELRARTFGRTLGNRVPVEVLAARIEPTGPPPADIETARTAVIDVFLRRMDVSDDGASLPNVDEGGDLGPYRSQVMSRWGHMAERTTTTVDLLKFVNDREAVIWWHVTLDGRPILGTLEGRVVFVDDTWKVAREVVCADFAHAGVQCPPPPETPDPAA